MAVGWRSTGGHSPTWGTKYTETVDSGTKEVLPGVL